MLLSLMFQSLSVHEPSGFVGYYGLGEGITTYVRVTENIDLQTMIAQAQVSGYSVTYRRAYEGELFTHWTPHLSSIRSGIDGLTGAKYIGINYYVGMNETFDYAVPYFAFINYHSNVSEEWIKLRLQEFFPQLTENESSDYANRLISSYSSIGISGSPVWEAVSKYIGNFSHVSCVPISSIYEAYSNGAIVYELPSVTISKEITLIWNRSVVFIVFVNGSGFVELRVNSKYMLDTNWIREVFEEMFHNIGLPWYGIMKYSINENWMLRH